MFNKFSFILFFFVLSTSVLANGPILSIPDRLSLNGGGLSHEALVDQMADTFFQSSLGQLESYLSSDRLNTKRASVAGSNRNFSLSFRFGYQVEPTEVEEPQADGSIEIKTIYHHSLALAYVLTDPSIGLPIVHERFTSDFESQSVMPDALEVSAALNSLFFEQMRNGAYLQDYIFLGTRILVSKLDFTSKLQEPYADGKTTGELIFHGIRQPFSGNHTMIIGEGASGNPLTHFKAKVNRGHLIDKDGNKVKELLFTGKDYLDGGHKMKIKYLSFDCLKEKCLKDEIFEIYLVEQNGHDVMVQRNILNKDFLCRKRYDFYLDSAFIAEDGTSTLKAVWKDVTPIYTYGIWSGERSRDLYEIIPAVEVMGAAVTVPYTMNDAPGIIIAEGRSKGAKIVNASLFDGGLTKCKVDRDMFEFQIQATRMDPGLAPYYSLTQGVINGTFNPHSIGLYLNTSINCKLPENAGDYQFNEFPEVGWIPLEVKSEAGINVIDGERNDQDLILKIRHGEEFSFEGKQVLDNGIIKQYKLEAKLSPNQCN